MPRMIEVLHNAFYKRVKDRIAVQTTILAQETLGQLQDRLEQRINQLVQEAIAAELDTLASIELTYTGDVLTVALNTVPPPASPPPIVETPAPPVPPVEPPPAEPPPADPVAETPPIEVVEPASVPVAEPLAEPAASIDDTIVDSPRVSP